MLVSCSKDGKLVQQLMTGADRPSEKAVSEKGTKTESISIHCFYIIIVYVIGERERANLVVRTAQFFCIILYIYTSVRPLSVHVSMSILRASFYVKLCSK